MSPSKIRLCAVDLSFSSDKPCVMSLNSFAVILPPLVSGSYIQKARPSVLPSRHRQAPLWKHNQAAPNAGAIGWLQKKIVGFGRRQRFANTTDARLRFSKICFNRKVLHLSGIHSKSAGILFPTFKKYLMKDFYRRVRTSAV